ncbi:MAG TPA: ATP-binding protein [Steroidobacteraceae bacterium]|nr:ATP-binding protein [Steroidobacteraceae bacterium]
MSADKNSTHHFNTREEKYRAESEWLAAVLNSMTEEVYFTDRAQRYTYANPAAMREFGHEAVAGLRVEDVVSDLEVLRADGTRRPVEESPPLRALSGEVIKEEEQIVRTPRTGELRHRQVNAAPVRNAAGDIIGSVSVVRDITERKRIEAAQSADLHDMALLRDLAARTIAAGDADKLFAEILDAAIKILRADAGTIQLLNEATQELEFAATRGFSAATVARFRYVDASSGSPCGVALSTGQRSFTVFDVPAAQDPDGSLRAHLVDGIHSGQSTPLISRTGRLLGMFSTHWKTRRALEERETRFLDLLGRQAADLIERLQNDHALRQRESDLRDADKRKDEFIAMLAHELRNPLVPIRTGIELLKKAASNPGVVDSVQPMMERQIAHMVRLIDDLLDVARITAGKIDLKRAPSGLAAIVTAAVDANRKAIDAAGLRLDVQLPVPDVVIDADATRLSQVLSNLLHNATKFTPAGGTVTVSARRSGTGADARLELRVADSGVGISAEQMPKVFDLFAQSGARLHAHETGLGIGLAIARKLIELHGGTIDARSAGRDRGTEFTITLPLPAELPAAAPAADSTSARLANQRIVIVDDNHDAADSMSMLIEFAGGETKVAYSAPMAFELIESFRPGVVLLDIGMPGMDGYEACRRLRAKYGDALGIIAVSGWGQQSDKDFALRVGFDAHLTKPADPEALTSTIARLATRKTA